MPSYDNLIRSGQDRFKRQLARDSLDSAKRLHKAYAGVLKDVNGKLSTLQKDARKMASSRDLAQAESLIKLRQSLRADLKSFSENIAIESSRLQTPAAITGVRVAAENLNAIGVGFAQPSTAAIRELINYTDRAAFKSSVAHFAPYHTERVQNIVLTGVSRGSNPITIAREITRYVENYPLADALRQVRTVQLYSARKGSQALYQANSDIVTEWVWSAAIGDPNTCLSCISLHGQHFPLDEILNDHYNGRCAMIPVTSLLGIGNIQTGEEWFSNLPESRQADLMGKSMFSAFKDNLFTFDQLSVIYHDDLYGTMRHEASLTDLIGSSAAKDLRGK